MIYWLENTIRAARRYFSRSEWAVRHLHLPTSQGTSHEPGLLIIQIDGLSREQMERAMRRRRMPFLRSLLRRQHYKLHTFYSGVPSTTPAVQGELFYGVRCAVPSFSFLDRKTRRVATMYHEQWARFIEERLLTECKGEPLLKGGSSWSNIYSGGATMDDTHFCAANIGPGGLFKSASFFGVLAFVLMHIPSIVRLLVLLVVELFLGLWDAIVGIFRGQNLVKEFKFIVSRIVICIGLRELVTVGAKIDLARGVPIVHANFLGYDEQSHCRGPGSPFAHWSLRGIDSAIEKLYRGACRSSRRDYQVWIFSDHGQEATKGYAEKYKDGVEATISHALQVLHKKEKRNVRLRSQQRVSRAYWSGGRRARRKFAEYSEEELLTEGENESFAVTAMGPVGNVYFAFTLDDAQKLELAQWLVTHGHVPGVLYKTVQGDVLWVHPDGKWKVPEDVPKVFSHPDDLKPEVARDLACLCDNEFAGDIIVLGCNPDGCAWTFPIERGAHGGPGSTETQGFCLLPARTRLPTQRSFIRPGELRETALHVLGRKKLRTRRDADWEKPVKLRVMTYNVHGCQGMDGKISPHRIGQILQMHHPDIIALQEIDLGRPRSHWHDQSMMIADQLGMNVVFCPVVVRGEELYGHALLSRFPMEVVLSDRFHCPETAGCEVRGALLVKLTLHDVDLYVLNTHLGLGRRERVGEMRELLGRKWLGKVALSEPLIVCGDFNMMPGSIPYRAISNRLHDAQLGLDNFRPIKTFAASIPIGRIDHVFTSGHFQVRHVDVPKNDLTRIASDHLPLVVDLNLTHKITTDAPPKDVGHGSNHVSHSTEPVLQSHYGSSDDKEAAR